MAIKNIYNPLAGGFDAISETDTSVLVGKLDQTAQTTDNILTPFAGSQTITTDTTTRFKSNVVGRGTAGEIYHYEVEGSISNDGGVLTLGSITGILHEEATVCGVDATTGHAITVSTSGTELDFGVTGTAGTTIEWKIETVFTEV